MRYLLLLLLITPHAFGQISNTKSPGFPSFAGDTAFVPGSLGGLIYAVRNDAGTALALDGNYIPFTTDATGQLRVAATFNEVATAADGAVGLPAVVKVIGGYDGTNVQAILTDASGRIVTALYDGAGVAVPLGQAVMASSLPVVIASNQSNINTNLHDGAGVSVPVGQAAMAASLPVVISSDQSNIKTNLYDGAGVAVPVGQAVMAASLPVVLSSDQSNIDTNLHDGAGVAVPVGQALMAASLPVVLSSDQSNIDTNLHDGAGVAVPVGQALMAASLPVVISSDQSLLGTYEDMDVKEIRYQDCAVDNINDSAGLFVEVGGASAAAFGSSMVRIQLTCTFGEPLEFRKGTSAANAATNPVEFIVNRGCNNEIPVTITAADRLWVRSLTTSSVTSGELTMNFIR